MLRSLVGSEMCIRDRFYEKRSPMEYSLLLTFSPPYYPSKCSESHAEYAPLPRIVYFVGKWAISGHPWATIFMLNEKSFPLKSTFVFGHLIDQMTSSRLDRVRFFFVVAEQLSSGEENHGSFVAQDRWCGVDPRLAASKIMCASCGGGAPVSLELARPIHPPRVPVPQHRSKRS